MLRTVTLIPGDGIGPEIIDSVKTIFEAAKAPITWEEINAGQTALEKVGKLIPDDLIESIKKNKVGLKGPITTPVGKGFKSINIQLRQLFDLYSNIRPSKNIPGVASCYDNVDLVLFRENTEGLYAGLEYWDEKLQLSDSIARVSKVGCERIVRAAFEFARTRPRKKVTVVHKANILKIAGATLLNAAAEVAKDFPDVEMEDMIIDSMCMQLVMKPWKFDVIVTTNLFGDILSDLCAGLVGGLGVVAGLNLGKEVALFEAVHGSAPDIAGKGIANPTAVLKSAIMMLEYLKEFETAARINTALEKTLAVKEECTGDLGGKANTITFTNNIIKNL
ncbi:MAG TPA: isocitrate/isopropylmalate family dehydrogenase [Cytophagaceae bacterium]|jgi:isocitrate dehydrogenase (NAD+)